MVPKALYRVEGALAQTQDGQTEFEDAAVESARTHGALCIGQCVEFDALKVFADESQSGICLEVLGQVIDYKVAPVHAHFLGEYENAISVFDLNEESSIF
ncbi:hypothetical protein [Rhodoferax aquaticus]|uniref:Uncharacterized protein n=1 Tax=Rhodoferax aquaticus TaxID=2527691 RepID=A0A515ESV7_9BURK|nr:hypothetical protein [Rhodoferax aquaticus]QDL55762.1 hypothetical protein EXZ61_17160 [Rhodoferax aquaticus]